MVKSFIFGAMALIFASNAHAAKLMTCSFYTYTFEIVEKGRQLDESGIWDIKLDILLKEKNKPAKRFNNSIGWIKQNGEFNFSLCDSNSCNAPSLSGQIVSDYVRGGDVIFPADVVDDNRNVMTCKVY